MSRTRCGVIINRIDGCVYPIRTKSWKLVLAGLPPTSQHSAHINAQAADAHLVIRRPALFDCRISLETRKQTPVNASEMCSRATGTEHIEKCGDIRESEQAIPGEISDRLLPDERIQECTHIEKVQSSVARQVGGA